MASLTGLLSLFGCAPYKTFYEGTYAGQHFVVQEKETKGFSTNSLTHRVQLGDLPAADISVETTDWGPPYSLSIYGNAPVQPLETPLPAYNPHPDFRPREHPRTMLYLSPAQFSRAQFDQYAAFMKQEWPAVNRKYGSQEYGSFPYLIGLVYGDRSSFEHNFEGQLAGKPFIITVEPDGRIRCHYPGKYGDPNSKGLPEAIEPNNTLTFTPGTYQGLTRAELREFKDAQGKALESCFMVVDKPATP